MKFGGFFKKCSLAVLVFVLLSACMDPIAFNPEETLATIAVTGQLDFIDVTSAVIMFSNRSKTIEVTNIVITQPDVPDTLIEFNGKPQPLTNKAQYVRPSDKEYLIKLSYADHISDTDGVIEIVIAAPIPKETYWLYIYRTKDGIVVVDKEFETDIVDREDTGNPAMIPEDEGEGSVPWIIPKVNEDHMGVFVVVNLTRDQDIDYVEFANSEDTSYSEYKKYRINGEPKHSDMQGIALGQGQWKTHIAYTAGGVQKTTDVKTAQVMSMRSTTQSQYNYMYFYKTLSGSYDLSMWPPSPGTYSEEVDMWNILPEQDTVLEIVNRSKQNIAQIKINGVESLETGIMMTPDEARHFVVPVGRVTVQFAPYTNGQEVVYGLTLPRNIVAKQINTISYYESLGDPDAIETSYDEGFGVGKIKILNKANATVQRIYVIDPDDPLGMKLNIPSAEFTPAGPINTKDTGWVNIIGSEDFPLVDSRTYLLQVESFGNDGLYYTEYSRVVKGRLASIEIEDVPLKKSEAGTIPGSAAFGSKVTVKNEMPVGVAALSVSGIQVYNAGNPNQKSYYGSTMWSSGKNVGNGEEASVYVISSPEMPIVNGSIYKADMFITVNGRYMVITKEFSPDGVLYDVNPDEHIRTLTISEADAMALIGEFKAVEDITGIPDEATSLVLVLPVEGLKMLHPGEINLNAAQVSPLDATNKTITWTKSGSNQGSYKIENGLLTVTETKAAGSTTQIQVTATIENGKGTVSAPANYTKAFNITLKYVTAADSNLATSLNATDMEIFVGQNVSLLGQVKINPANAVKDGIPIDAFNLTFTGNNGAIASVSGSTVSGMTEGTVTVTATLPAQYCAGGTALTTTFDVTVHVVGAGTEFFTPVTDITYTAATVTSTIMPDTGGTLLIPGWLNLNTAKVYPVNATKQNINWSVVSGDTDYIDTAKLSQGIVLVTKGSTSNKSVKIRATVPNGAAGQVDYTKEYTITLSFTAWTYNNPVSAIELVTPASGGGDKMSIYEQDVKSLLGMVKLVTANGGTPFYNGRPITVNDLTWTAKNKTAGGDVIINSTNMTGKSAGMLQIYATLASAKNGGTTRTGPDISVSVFSTPLISQNAKAAFWFLFLSVTDGIVFVPTSDVPTIDVSSFTDSERLTGVTTRTWADTDADFNKTSFLKKFPNAIISGRLSTMGYTPGVIDEGQPRPMTYPDSGKYFVFFLKEESGKSDMRVYGNGAATPAGNTLFLLDLEKKGPSIVLNATTGSATHTAMGTDQIKYNAALTGIIPESSCTISTDVNTYYNSMGIPIGIYRFKYWGNKIEFRAGNFKN